MSVIEDIWARMEEQAERQAAEVARLDAVRAKGYVPSEVGPEIPEAPARGPVRMVEMMASYPKGDDGFEVKPSGFMGRKTLQRADSFDVMAAKAARHKKPAPFSPSQVAMGRFYRDLVEKHASAGMKCSSMESLSQRGSGSDGGGYMDAVLRDSARIAALHKRIGDGSALVVRRIRPSARGSRVSITDRRLVDIICLEEGTMSDVLRAHGWSVKSDHIKALTQALREALDRMMGPVHPQKASAVHYGSGCIQIWE